jgi:hypothetical protein
VKPISAAGNVKKMKIKSLKTTAFRPAPSSFSFPVHLTLIELIRYFISSPAENAKRNVGT